MIVTDKWHPTALIDATAEIEPGVEIGPYCIIGRECFIGAGTVLHAHAQVMEYTRIGRNCQIYGGTILGGAPQDRKFKGEKSYLEIGSDNILREYVTIHRATGEGAVTRVGSNNMVMAYAHIGHNCDIGSHINISPYVGISGHVTVEDYVNFGGMTGIHQGARVGTLAMVGAMSGAVRDIYPYMLVSGRPCEVENVNSHGLKRAGISPKVRSELKQAFRLLYRSNLNTTQALELIEEEIPTSPELDHLMTFIRKGRDGYNGRGNSTPPGRDWPGEP
jgi:UDP-N-acetylglucosamine acyltransferase